MAKYIGTAGDDYYLGTFEADLIKGGAGWDILYGEGGIDRIYGGAEDDDLYGGDARDYLYGEGDGDRLYGDAGNDIIYAGEGYDWAYGGVGNDYLVGNEGDDVLRGEAGNDRLFGGDGDDALRGGAGVDQVDGGSGVDSVSFFVPGVTQGVIVDLRTQTLSNDGFGNAETLVSIESAGGSTGADTILGTDTANVLTGGKGDTIRGFGGTDIFYIETVQNSTFDGGTGVNSLRLTGRIDGFDADGKITMTYAEQGMIVDLAKGQVSNDGFGYAAAIAGFRNATTSDGNDTIIGNTAANTLYSGVGDDILSGGGGDDLLHGDLGADTMTGGAGNDIFAFGINFEYYLSVAFDQGDVITDFTQGQDKLDIRPSLAPLLFIGTDSLDGYRSAINYEISDGDTYIHVKEGQGANTFTMTIELEGVHELTVADFVAVKTAAEPIDFAHGPHAFHAPIHGDLASLALA